MKPNNSLIGSAGVHFVCAELSRRGFIALPTIRNTPGVDVIIKTPNGKKIDIQVKTSWAENHWLCPVKDEQVKDDSFFIFVNLHGESGNPDFYIIPSGVVKDQVNYSFKAWVETPGKNGRPHDPKNRIRTFPARERRFKSEAYRKYLLSPFDLSQYKEWKLE